MFKEIEHVHITTSNLAESIKFYTEILGFKVHEKLIINNRGISEVAHLHLNNSMMALIVEDMEEAINHLKANNVTITRDPKIMSDENRGGFRGEFQDNNGVTIEIRQLGN